MLKLPLRGPIGIERWREVGMGGAQDMRKGGEEECGRTGEGEDGAVGAGSGQHGGGIATAGEDTDGRHLEGAPKYRRRWGRGMQSTSLVQSPNVLCVPDRDKAVLCLHWPFRRSLFFF